MTVNLLIFQGKKESFEHIISSQEIDGIIQEITVGQAILCHILENADADSQNQAESYTRQNENDRSEINENRNIQVRSIVFNYHLN